MINKIINKFTNSFTDTIFYKKDSELEYQIKAVENVLKKYPTDERLKKKLKICKLGLQGEKEIEFELKNASIGMYVLHDINLEFDGNKAQIDYIIITPAKNYLIECKNLIGDISIDSKGNFIREYSYGRKKYKEGIYSPVTQAERHSEILKKIWSKRNTGFLDKTIRLKNWDKWYQPLVVLSNSKNIINDKYAPKCIKDIVIKSDGLVKYIKNDIEKADKDLLWKQKEMHEMAYSLMQNYNKEIERDYEKELEEWIKKNPNNKSLIDFKKPVDKTEDYTYLYLKNKLMEYRKIKSKEKGIPAYYIFNNKEMDEIIDLKPKSLKELRKSNLLEGIKLNLYGEEIVKLINE